MKLLQFAVASIVDANTGYGLAHGASSDYSAAEKQGRSIRARSVIAVLDLIKQHLASALEGYRRRAAQRRQLAILSSLNDHALRDIGFTRGDIVAVELGQIKFDELEANRQLNQRPTSSNCAKLVQIGASGREPSAVNEAIFARAKCA